MTGYVMDGIRKIAAVCNRLANHAKSRKRPQTTKFFKYPQSRSVTPWN